MLDQKLVTQGRYKGGSSCVLKDEQFAGQAIIISDHYS